MFTTPTHSVVEGMGDPKADEHMTGQDEHIAQWPDGPDTTSNSDLAVYQQNRRGTMDWPAEKQHMMNKKAVSHAVSTRFSSDGSDSGRHVSEQKPGVCNDVNADGLCTDCFEGKRAPGPSPALLSALASLGENTNHMLLPHSLHQVSLITCEMIVLRNGSCRDCPVK